MAIKTYRVQLLKKKASKQISQVNINRYWWLVSLKNLDSHPVPPITIIIQGRKSQQYHEVPNLKYLLIEQVVQLFIKMMQVIRNLLKKVNLPQKWWAIFLLLKAGGQGKI